MQLALRGSAGPSLGPPALQRYAETEHTMSAKRAETGLKTCGSAMTERSPAAGRRLTRAAAEAAAACGCPLARRAWRAWAGLCWHWAASDLAPLHG